MGGRTFRSRWVVRWGIIFGGLCTAVALLLFVAAYQKSQTHDVAAEAAAERNAKTCEEQIANGTGGADSPCQLQIGATANESAKGFLSAGVLLIVGLTQLIGAGRMGITLTGPGIIVRNPLRTYRLRWSEIKGFRTEVGQRGPMSYAFGRVDLLNGDTHRIEAICAMPWEPKDRFLDKRVIDALNAELEAHRDDDREDWDDDWDRGPRVTDTISRPLDRVDADAGDTVGFTARTTEAPQVPVGRAEDDDRAVEGRDTLPAPEAPAVQEPAAPVAVEDTHTDEVAPARTPRRSLADDILIGDPTDDEVLIGDPLTDETNHPAIS